MSLVSVNGVVMTEDRATIPWNDRGFQLGDGLFETMLVESGRVPFIDLHLDRLFASAAFLEMRLPREDWLVDWIETLLRELSAHSCALRLTVSRGAGGDLAGASVAEATVVIGTRSLASESAGGREEVAIAPARFVPPALGRRLKGQSYQATVMAQRALATQGLREGVLLSDCGELMEGTVSNLFGVEQGILRTAPLEAGVLPGITRRRVLVAARDLGLDVLEEPIRVDGLSRAAELFYTNALRGVVSIARLRRTTWESTSDDVADALRAQLSLDIGS